MSALFSMHQRFGTFLSSGEAANAFRFTEVEPVLSRGESIVFDFEGVTNMTSSFSNALVATLMAHHPTEFGDLVRFKNCDPVIKCFVSASISLGRKESKEFA